MDPWILDTNQLSWAINLGNTRIMAIFETLRRFYVAVTISTYECLLAPLIWCNFSTSGYLEVSFVHNSSIVLPTSWKAPAPLRWDHYKRHCHAIQSYTTPSNFLQAAKHSEHTHIWWSLDEQNTLCWYNSALSLPRLQCTSSKATAWEKQFLQFLIFFPPLLWPSYHP